MPEELVGIVIVMSILAFIATIVRSTQQYKLKKLDRQGGAADESLTTSELHRMIETAVDEATSSLQSEVAVLSERLGRLEAASPLQVERNHVLGDKTVGRVRQRER